MKPKRIIQRVGEAKRLSSRKKQVDRFHQSKASNKTSSKTKISFKNHDQIKSIDDDEDEKKLSDQTLNINQEGFNCSGCNQMIKDRFLLSAGDKYWHDDCLRCDRCQMKLGELGSTLYERDKMNLCRQDYFEMFGQKAICSVCDKLIYASEMVMRAKQNVYHLECFACQLCGLRFCIGDRFYLCENKIVCQFDYDEHIMPIQELMQFNQQQEQKQQQNHHLNDHQESLAQKQLLGSSVTVDSIELTDEQNLNRSSAITDQQHSFGLYPVHIPDETNLLALAESRTRLDSIDPGHELQKKGETTICILGEAEVEAIADCHNSLKAIKSSKETPETIRVEQQQRQHTNKKIGHKVKPTEVETNEPLPQKKSNTETITNHD